MAADDTCKKLCDIGYTKINTSAGHQALLFTQKVTTPAINISAGNSVCYAELIPGTTDNVAIYVEYNNQKYHTHNAPKTSSCVAGYYLDSTEFKCVDCGRGYYCPGDGARYACRDLVPADTVAYVESIKSLTGGSHSLQTNAANSTDCVCQWNYPDARRTQTYAENECEHGPFSELIYNYYYWCRVGYYATEPAYTNNFYKDCAPCTNGPENSHYTSYSTPSVMYAVESNCPWECDDGFVQNGDTCILSDVSH